MAQTVKHLPTVWEIWVQSPGWEDLLEKEMAIHFSILAWKIPWTEEPAVHGVAKSRTQLSDFAHSLITRQTATKTTENAEVFFFNLAMLGLCCSTRVLPTTGGFSCPKPCGICFPTSDWTRIPCIGRRVLKHWTSRKSWETVLFRKNVLSKPEVQGKSLWKRTIPSSYLVTQSCLTLCDPIDCSLPGSSVHGILQARKVEWVAISFPSGSSRPREQTQVSLHRRWILCQLSYQGSPEQYLDTLLLQFTCHSLQRASHPKSG